MNPNDDHPECPTCHMEYRKVDGEVKCDCPITIGPENKPYDEVCYLCDKPFKCSSRRLTCGECEEYGKSIQLARHFGHTRLGQAI